MGKIWFSFITLYPKPINYKEKLSYFINNVTHFQPATKKWEKFMAICYDIMLTFNPMEKHNLSVFYDDRALLVLPDYRGLGIAEALFKTRLVVHLSMYVYNRQK